LNILPYLRIQFGLKRKQNRGCDRDSYTEPIFHNREQQYTKNSKKLASKNIKKTWQFQTIHHNHHSRPFTTTKHTPTLQNQNKQPPNKNTKFVTYHTKPDLNHTQKPVHASSKPIQT